MARTYSKKSHLYYQRWCEAFRLQNGIDYHTQYARERRQQAIEILGGECSSCGIADIRVLQIDHINGGGHQELLEKGSNHVTTKIFRGETDDYQILCANCNWIKRWENNENGNYFENPL